MQFQGQLYYCYHDYYHERYYENYDGYCYCCCCYCLLLARLRAGHNSVRKAEEDKGRDTHPLGG